VLLFEEALNLFCHIRDRWGEVLALEGQGEELLKLEAEAMNAGLVALWQAREISRTLGASSAQRLDAFFEQMQARVDTQVWAGLATGAEAMRQAGLETVRQGASGQNPEAPKSLRQASDACRFGGLRAVALTHPTLSPPREGMGQVTMYFAHPLQFPLIIPPNVGSTVFQGVKIGAGRLADDDAVTFHCDLQPVSRS
jgi:hypothetical protein